MHHHLEPILAQHHGSHHWEEKELIVLLAIFEGMSVIMAAIDDLNTSIANLTAAVDAVLARPTGVPETDVETAATEVQAQVDRLASNA